MKLRPPLPLSTAALLCANAVPLFGVAFLGWDLFSIMVLYWAENGIIGLLNVPKMLLATGPNLSPERPPASPTSPGVSPIRADAAAKVTMIPFFLLHYGMFWTVHGVLVFSIFGPPRGPTTTVALAALPLLASHVVSFFVNYVGRREYLNTSTQSQMGQPYGRVMVLHLTILGGGFLASALGAPVYALAILVALKTALDLRSHLREHARA